MPDQPSARQRMLFIAAVLGIAIGISVYLVFKVSQTERYVLLLALPAMWLAMIPMIKSFAKLRDERNRGSSSAQDA